MWLHYNISVFLISLSLLEYVLYHLKIHCESCFSATIIRWRQYSNLILQSSLLMRVAITFVNVKTKYTYCISRQINISIGTKPWLLKLSFI